MRNNSIKRLFIKYFIVLSIFAIIALNLTSCKKKELDEVIKLDCPTNVHLEGRIVYWDDVINADGYVLYFNNEEHYVKDTEFDFSGFGPDNYNVEIFAYSKNQKYDDSKSIFYNFEIVEPIAGVSYTTDGFKMDLMPDESGYIISHGKNKLIGDIVLPDFYCNLPVKEIAEYGFSPCDTTHSPDPFLNKYMYYETTSIILPKYLEKINFEAFAGLGSIKKIELPQTLEETGGSAFVACTSLEEVIIPEGVKKISADCFEYCNIKNINLPNSLECIGVSAFAGATRDEITFANAFETIIIPENVTEISDSAFANCYNLKNVEVLSSKISAVGQNPFFGTPFIEEQKSDYKMLSDYILLAYTGENRDIVIPNNVTVISSRVLPNSFEAKSIILNNGLETICSKAFVAISTFTSITIPKTVEFIGNDAFLNCWALAEIINLSTLNIQIGSKENGCVGLYAKYISTDENYQSKIISIDDFRFIEKDDTYYLIRYVGVNEDVILPNDVFGHKYIIDRQAMTSKYIQTIYIPKAVISINERAFSSCYNLHTVTMEDGVTSIGNLAFSGCSKLSSIKLSNKITFIGTSAISWQGHDEVNIYYDGTKEEFDSILFGNNAIRSGYVLHCNNGNFNQ